MKKARVGIFGGAFDPPHNGHLCAAKAFYDSMQLDRLIIIPSFVPPHKVKSKAMPSDRLEMASLAFKSIENSQISSCEIDRGGVSYTYLTIEEYYSDDVELYLFVGTDMFLTLSEWDMAQDIFKAAGICLIRRESLDENEEAILNTKQLYEEKYVARISIITSPVVEMSSTQVRKMLAAGDNAVTDMLPREVMAYIRERGLYI